MRPLAILLAAGCLVGTAISCPFCSITGSATLSEEVDQADVVLFGTLSESSLDAAGVGTTQMLPLVLIKAGDGVAVGKQVQLSRFIARARGEPADYLIFAEITPEGLDPYRAIPTPANPPTPNENGESTAPLVEYLRGAHQMAGKPAAQRLAFFFDRLDDPVLEIAEDAYKEFAKAPYKDVVAATAAYEPDRIRGWIDQSSATNHKIGLFGILLGLSGKPEQADYLRARITDPSQRPLNGVDGLLGGLCVLRPKEGAVLATDLLNDPREGFNVRYSALQAVRFLLDELDGYDREMVLNRLADALAIADMNDLIVDELRKRQVWQAHDRVLGLVTADARYSSLRSAVLRYAIVCPEPASRRFLDEQRQSAPNLVTAAEDALRFEASIAQSVQEAREKPPTRRAARQP